MHLHVYVQQPTYKSRLKIFFAFLQCTLGYQRGRDKSGVLEQESWDRIANRTAGTGQLEVDSWGGHLGQDNCGRAAMVEKRQQVGQNMIRQNNWDRKILIHRQNNSGRTAMTI
jgi:hypothetical protein